MNSKERCIALSGWEVLSMLEGESQFQTEQSVGGHER